MRMVGPCLLEFILYSLGLSNASNIESITFPFPYIPDKSIIFLLF